MNKILEIKNINKTFNINTTENLTVLDNLSLDVYEEEFICILGPSGSGKSSLLRIISALDKPSQGEIIYRGKPYTRPSKEIGFVFQDYSLLPWLTVKENIKLGLEFNKVNNKDEIADEYLKLINLCDFSQAKPFELSGGMRQRVAIARSLANNPDILLMDEPFGALDAFTRIILQRELLRIWLEHKKTILFVTHSVEEAVFLADRIVLLSNDRGQIHDIITIDIPRERDRSSPEFNELNKHILKQYETLSKGTFYV